ncbi:ankyrin repeat, PH and SEC7 domain containing protein secG-like [Mizuhopecten yessoensis]|uniref:Ankyrin repeat, PH and SEC7 domain containing protein secG n=1 Tax=Mizuhopecten yessoensis TaxID=6573 RepID=A0A210Q9I5_MIZYE|nr:ankyrin repeat, PH and SEC7 domain containing protein secG-like [Mizuhopecten yessoensis]OWF45349.1 Ankyrin repeat, PH and SEC7 domain containing protein secG [Mizuhopecten yessoensis]
MAHFRKRKSTEMIQKDFELDRKLVLASKEGDFEEVKRLAELGASPDSTEYNKNLFYASQNYTTPLQNAAANGYHEIVQYLIEKGADINAKDRFDVTALHMAAEMGHRECLQKLLDAEALCNVGTKYSKQGSYTAFPHAGGTTPLHLAAANNHIDCVTKLIWDGADYNAVDEFGRTSLYIAAQKTFEDCVHAHLNNAIWKDILSLPSKQTGDTPLHECVKNGMLSCVESLLKRGSDVNHKNMAGFSPLHLVVQANKTFSMDMLRQLVMNGYNTDVNIPESLGYSPLHYVCFHETSMQERRPEAAALLIAYGASYKILNRQGDNVLQYELRNKNTDRTILHAIVKSEAYLPTLESLGAVSAHILPPDARDPRHQGIMNLNRSDEQYAKLSWYRDLCKDPRPLQHYCRCVIRNTVGVRRLSKIDTLPLPTTLKEYLHLTLEEFRS